MYVCTHECMHAWLCMDMNDYVQIAMYVCFAIYVTIKEGPALAKIVSVGCYVCMYVWQLWMDMHDHLYLNFIFVYVNVCL